jgi:hypothetical protein
MSNITRDEVKKLAVTIESLAHGVQSALDNNGDVLAVANELVRNNLTLVFALGEFYATQSSPATTKSVSAKVVSNPNNTKVANWHNVRDSRGRFAPKSVNV